MDKNYKVMGLLIPRKRFKKAPKRFYGIYTQDAKEMPYGLTVEAVEAWKEFFGYKPCLLKYGHNLGYLDEHNYSIFESGRPITNKNEINGDIMVEYPRMGLRIRYNDKAIEICVTNDPHREGFTYHAFPEIEGAPIEHFYLGAYRGSLVGKAMRSLPDQRIIPSSQYSFEDMCHLAHRRGKRYTPMGFYQALHLQVMYLFLTRGTLYNTYPLLASFIESKGASFFDDDMLICNGKRNLFGLNDFTNGVHYDLLSGCFIRDGELYLTETPAQYNEFRDIYACKGRIQNKAYGDVIQYYPSSEFGFLDFDSTYPGMEERIMGKDTAGIQEYYDAEKTIPAFFQHGMFDMDFSVPNNVGTIHGTTRLMYL